MLSFIRLLAGGLVVLGVVGLAFAEETPPSGPALEDVLEGFDDSPPASEMGLDDVLEGFDGKGEEPKGAAPSDSPERGRIWEIGGSLTLASAWNHAHKAPVRSGETDYRGLSRLRAEAQLDIDVDLPGNWKGFVSGRGFHDFAYAMKGRGGYTRETLDAYEEEAELRDAYIQGTLAPRLDIKIGRQVVVWGKSDNIRITDILNPLDNREPGMVDIEDLRLPVGMTRIDWYSGEWNLTGILVHEIRFSKNPAYGSDFYPSSERPPAAADPEQKLENTQYALALNGIFSGWDVSFYMAQFYNDREHRELAPSGKVRRHARLNMGGAAMNVAIGNWLIIAEGAYLDGLRFFGTPARKSRYDILAGVEYKGITDTTVAVDLANRHIVGFEEKLGSAPDMAREDETQAALRVVRDFMHQRLQFVFLALAFGPGGSGGGMQRYSLKYDLTDSFNLTGGVIVYQPGSIVPFGAIGDNDRFFFDIKYSF